MKYLLLLAFLFTGCSSFHVCHKDTKYFDAVKCEEMKKAKEEDQKNWRHPGRN